MTEREPPSKRLFALRHPPVESFAGAVGHLELAQLSAPAPLAAALAPSLAALGLRQILSSPRRRCHDIAERLAAHLGIPLHVDERLRELDHGRWTGHRWEEIEAYDHAAYHYWLTQWISQGPPDGGESADALTARVRAAIIDAPSDSLLVTHRGPLQALHHLSGMRWPDAAAVRCANLGEPGALISVEVRSFPSFTLSCLSRYDVESNAGATSNHDS